LSYQVLALKWRPRTFDEVVGQATVSRTLAGAIRAGRVAHAFLFTGVRGVGKTTAARILAKALNCEKGPTSEPCLGCSSCLEIAAGSSFDVQEIDGATNNGVEQVRELRESARYRPARDRFKIWIIDEVHMLSSGAFNALLKTLEEPPPRVKFIFATTEYHKIPETILSRCQQYDFRMIPARELLAHLRRVADEEAIRISDEALTRLARAAEGSARDALSLFDQVLAFSGEQVKDDDVTALLGLVDRELLLRASGAVLSGDSLGLLELVESLADYGADYRSFVRELVLHFRQVLLVRVAPEDGALLAAVPAEERERLKPLAQAFSEEDLLRILDGLTKAETELRLAPDPRVTLELALLKLGQLRRLIPFVELVERVERLAGGSAPGSEAQAAPRSPEAPGPPARRPAAPPAPPPQAPASPPAEPSATGDGVLARMIEMAQSRPSLQQALRGASARLEDDLLILDVPADFAALARLHEAEYQDLVRQAAGRAVRLRLGSAAAAEPDPPSADDLRRQRLRQEAEREPAVQEALSLFDGRVSDVREAKPAKEGA
jgi:DNA polymerase-3 subunit gamma/tau